MTINTSGPHLLKFSFNIPWPWANYISKLPLWLSLLICKMRMIIVFSFVRLLRGFHEFRHNMCLEKPWPSVGTQQVLVIIFTPSITCYWTFFISTRPCQTNEAKEDRRPMPRRMVKSCSWAHTSRVDYHTSGKTLNLLFQSNVFHITVLYPSFPLLFVDLLYISWILFQWIRPQMKHSCFTFNLLSLTQEISNKKGEIRAKRKQAMDM